MLLTGKTSDPIWQFLENEDMDPIWIEFTQKASQSAPIGSFAARDICVGRGIHGLFKKTCSFFTADARIRRQRNENIANAHEWELSSVEKVLLLISSYLNDKRSFPGHIYRHLMLELHRREKERRWSRWEEDLVVLDGKKRKDGIYGTIREDTHAVIKHVTIMLLKTRPELGASASMMEMSLNAVEALIFGEVYDSVFREFIDHMREEDEALMIKISEFQIKVGRKFLTRDSRAESSSRSSKSNSGMKATTENIMVPVHNIDEFVSDDALKFLRMLPESHTVNQKLRQCVQFLELIAPSSRLQAVTDENQPNVKVQTRTNNKTSIGTDSLLKMVCQHIIVAKVPNLNAEIAFLEEFARDDQLLRGKEGYALVTMRASLRFMNSSTDFGKDIYHNDDKCN